MKRAIECMASWAPTFLIVLLAVSVFPSVGCDRWKPERRPGESFAQQQLLIGLIPEQNIFRQRERYQFLGDYLSRRLGVKVIFTSLSSYGNVIEHFTTEKMDGAFFGSFTYALARRQLGVEPVARPVNPDGTTTYHGYLFARRDSGIRNVAGLRGKRFAFVDRATTAGYLFPLAYFRGQGVRVHPEAFVKEALFYGSHDAAILAVLNREADAGAAKNTIYDQMARENSRIGKELVILATSGVVPENCLAVRKDLDPKLRSALRQALVAMDRDAEGEEALKRFGARGFIETNDRDYAYLYSLAAEAGLDFKTYRYQSR
ncbi:MAG TPA: phosphate/phosphite/phosphonate ABC transporter substrate-binding protein [Nitrospirota bacterium]|nr:phosphate/phosphite/phosphonate ABC transporter substrate-binding protein [Nitrospirota bacterium]